MSYLFLVSPDVVGIGSEYFVVYLSCVYIYIRLIMSSYLIFVSTSMFGVSHAVQMKSSGIYIDYRVIVEVLVLGLPVVVCKIAHSSCM